MRTFIACFVLIAGLILTARWTVGQDFEGPKDEDLKQEEPVQVISTKEVMELLFDPLYVDIRNIVRDEPDSRKEWRGLYIAAFTLAEVNNLLFSREDFEYMKTEDWKSLSLDARQDAVNLGEAVKSQDYGEIKRWYLQVVENCNACHERFEAEDAPEVKPMLGESAEEEEPSGIGIIQ